MRSVVAFFDFPKIFCRASHDEMLITAKAFNAETDKITPFSKGSAAAGDQSMTVNMPGNTMTVLK